MTAYWIACAVYYVVHLIFCFLEKETARKITKVLIVPFLMAGLLLTRTDQPLVLLGLFLGWLGDIFLIFPQKKRSFLIGTGCFISGHFAYIAATISMLLTGEAALKIPAFLWVILGGTALVLFALAYKKVSRHLGVIAYVGAAYFTVLAGALLLSIAAHQCILTAAFAMFILSDTILSVCRFAKKVKREHFYIMSTYILSQTLICIGFIYS